MRRPIRQLMLLLVLSACSGDRLVEQRHFAMGTWVDISFATQGSTSNSSLFNDLQSFLSAFGVDYYAWADGELATINRALHTNTEIVPTKRMYALLETAQRLSHASDGYFDPAVGDLVELWGFHSTQTAANLPTATQISTWLEQHSRIDTLILNNGRLRSASGTSGTIQLDLGGIAKGYAIDLLLEAIEATGTNAAMVNAGGDVRVLGSNFNRAWRIGIQAPRGDGVLGIIELADGEAAFTSGDYERFFESDGARQHHLLDPTTGYPATHTQAITVIAPNGVLADAAATAIFVAGPENWRRIASQLGIAAVLRVDASGSIDMTDAMRDRLSMQATREPVTMAPQQ